MRVMRTPASFLFLDRRKVLSWWWWWCEWPAWLRVCVGEAMANGARIRLAWAVDAQFQLSSGGVDGPAGW